MEYVWVVKKNADFTEGRGPMRLHKIFAHESDARHWIMDQQGIYGSKQGVSSVGSNNYNGYSIEKFYVIPDIQELERAAERKKEIAAQIKELQEEFDALKV